MDSKKITFVSVLLKFLIFIFLFALLSVLELTHFNLLTNPENPHWNLLHKNLTIVIWSLFSCEEITTAYFSKAYLLCVF